MTPLSQSTSQSSTAAKRELYAHLMRRAGPGVHPDDLDKLLEMRYEDVVEDLLHPERFPGIDEDLLMRYNPNYDIWEEEMGFWIFRMVNTGRPLVEKMAFFWHQIFATGIIKAEFSNVLNHQNRMFRRLALSDVRTLLIALSKDPAMLAWLDNNENFSDAINENYGRELLELFSMGVGNYTEEDIKSCSRAFTGWTFDQPVPTPGIYPSKFVYNAADHDDGEKTFLGETGRFNGEDIVDIICKQPATARFLARHLYTFFVADEPPVSAWNEIPPQDPEAISVLTDAYFESNGDVRTVMRVLFNSDFFKDSQFKRVKSPTELVTGTLMLTKGYQFTQMCDGNEYQNIGWHMGQQLMNPLTVEGWISGTGWINSSAINERVNFAVNEVNDAARPGIRAILNRLVSTGRNLTPDEMVDTCLDLAGPMHVGSGTRAGLLKFASSGAEGGFNPAANREQNEAKLVGMLRLIVATKEYQFG